LGKYEFGGAVDVTEVQKEVGSNIGSFLRTEF